MKWLALILAVLCFETSQAGTVADFDLRVLATVKSKYIELNQLKDQEFYETHRQEMMLELTGDTNFQEVPSDGSELIKLAKLRLALSIGKLTSDGGFAQDLSSILVERAVQVNPLLLFQPARCYSPEERLARAAGHWIGYVEEKKFGPLSPDIVEFFISADGHFSTKGHCQSEKCPTVLPHDSETENDSDRKFIMGRTCGGISTGSIDLGHGSWAHRLEMKLFRLSDDGEELSFEVYFMASREVETQRNTWTSERWWMGPTIFKLKRAHD